MHFQTQSINRSLSRSLRELNHDLGPRLQELVVIVIVYRATTYCSVVALQQMVFEDVVEVDGFR